MILGRSYLVSGAAKLKENAVRIYRAQERQICAHCGRQIEVGEAMVSVPIHKWEWQRSREYYHRSCFNKVKEK